MFGCYSLILAIWQQYKQNFVLFHVLRAVCDQFTAWKLSVLGVILVRIFPHSGWIRRDTVSLLINSECGKMRTRITPNTDTFYYFHSTASQWYLKFWLSYLRIAWQPELVAARANQIRSVGFVNLFQVEPVVYLLKDLIPASLYL